MSYPTSLAGYLECGEYGLRNFIQAILLGLFSCWCSNLHAQDFNNSSVVELTDVGVGDEVILTKIGSLPCSYDVSTQAIIELKQSGVSDRVIAAMVGRCVGSSTAQGAVNENSNPSIQRSPGIFIDQGSPGSHLLRRVRPTKGSGGKVTGNGSLIFPFKLKIALARSSAQIQAKSNQPTFYFYFETDDLKVGDFGVSGTEAAQSPSEFNLIELKVKKSNREITVAQKKVFAGSVGLDPDKAIQFSMQELETGIFSVTPDSPLEAGEYAFVLRSGSDTYRFYDFSILKAAAGN